MSVENALGRRRSLRVVGALAIGVFVLACVVSPVVAHAYLSDSDPLNGDRVDTVPEEVSLYFSGDGIQVADVSVTGPNGTDVSGDARIDAEDARVVHVPIEAEDPGEGMYTVRWEILADDGHTSSGSFFFRVGDEALDRDAVLDTYEEEAGDDGVSLLKAGAKGLFLITIAGLIGIPVITVSVIYPLSNRFGVAATVIDPRLTKVLTGVGVISFASALGLGLTRSTAVGPLSVDTVIQFSSTPLGRGWIAQLILTAVLTAVFLGATRELCSRRVWSGTALGGGLFVGATVSWTSHSATAIDRLQGTAVDVLHMTGAGLWVGGLFVLAVVVPPLLREIEPGERSALAARIVRRYSILAIVGVSLVVPTGLFLSSWHIPTVEGLSETLYGISFSSKVLLVLVALGLGGFTRFVLLGRLESNTPSNSIAGWLVGRVDSTQRRDRTDPVSTFTRAVRFEVAILLLVLIVSGVLTTIPTAAIVAQEQDTGAEIASAEQTVDDITIELAAGPVVSDTGAHSDRIAVHADEPLVFEVTFLDDGEPVESEQPVRLLANQHDGDETMEMELGEAENGTYTTVQTLPASGEWEIRVSGAPAGSFISEWFGVHVVSEEAHDHEREDTLYTTALQWGAIAVAVIGSVAVVFESIRFRRRET